MLAQRRARDRLRGPIRDAADSARRGA